MWVGYLKNKKKHCSKAEMGHHWPQDNWYLRNNLQLTLVKESSLKRIFSYPLADQIIKSDALNSECEERNFYWKE